MCERICTTTLTCFSVYIEGNKMFFQLLRRWFERGSKSWVKQAIRIELNVCRLRERERTSWAIQWSQCHLKTLHPSALDTSKRHFQLPNLLPGQILVLFQFNGVETISILFPFSLSLLYDLRLKIARQLNLREKDNCGLDKRIERMLVCW